MTIPLERLEMVLLAGAAGDGIGGCFEGHPFDRERDGDEVHQERTLAVAPRTDARDALHPRTRAECMGGARNALAQCKYGAETGDWGPFYDWVDYLLAHC